MSASASVSGKFRLSAKCIFLTYAQCTLTKEQVLEHLQSLKPIDKYVIAIENHQDGNPHIHAMIQFKHKFDTKDCRIFDILNFHPKIEATRKLKECYAYCTKEDDAPLQSIPPFEFKEKRKWEEAFDTQNKQDFLTKIKEISPRDYILNLERIQYCAEHIFKKDLPVFTPKYNLDSFTIPHTIRVWQDQFTDDRPKSLLIIGDSRLGKTQLIRTLYPHATYWYSMINLETFNPTCPIVIFDDFDWDKIPCKKGWLGAQHTIVVSDKYKKKQTIEWGRPCVILTNDDPVLSAWERANLIILRIRDPLYTLNSS